MMGDNRDGSADSRELSQAKFVSHPGAFKAKCENGTIDETAVDCFSKVGFVPKENLIGPAKILFWSYDSSNRWYNPITWITALRFGRLFNVIE
jgi:signal peptidase I